MLSLSKHEGLKRFSRHLFQHPAHIRRPGFAMGGKIPAAGAEGGRARKAARNHFPSPHQNPFHRPQG